VSVAFKESVTAVRYQKILKELLNLLHPEDSSNVYFQQDGATPHTTRMTLNYPREMYCSFNLVVGRKILWYFKLKILRGL
jgi:hypothetical protein